MEGTPLKPRVRGLLEEGRLEEIARIAETSKRVLGTLVTLTYDADARIVWGAVEALGAAAARVAETDPGAVREHLRRLMWLMSEECGGICWRAPEAMAEIVARRPELFFDYVPVVAHMLVETAEEDLAHFRPGMLWALGRLGPLAADEAGGVLPAVTSALGHADPQVRGMAVWCLGRLGRAAEVARHPHLREDPGAVTVYEEGTLLATSVAAITEAVIEGAGVPR